MKTSDFTWLGCDGEMGEQEDRPPALLDLPFFFLSSFPTSAEQIIQRVDGWDWPLIRLHINTYLLRCVSMSPWWRIGYREPQNTPAFMTFFCISAFFLAPCLCPYAHHHICLRLTSPVYYRSVGGTHSIPGEVKAMLYWLPMCEGSNTQRIKNL